MHWLLVLVSLVFALDARAVTIDWAAVGNPGNAPDTATNCYAANCGAVAEVYRISKYEITNAQYAAFLNAVAVPDDPFGLYDSSMSISALIDFTTGLIFYFAPIGFENKPVTYVSFYDALRFANWLNNGQGNADTETGAYTLLGGTATPSNGRTVLRNPGASIFLTSENEWYKAAYYDPARTSYFDYPAGSNAVTACSTPSSRPNEANCLGFVGGVTDVGAYTGSPSPSGTFDQGGNVWEWNDQLSFTPFDRFIRGGYWGNNAGGLAASSPYYFGDAANSSGLIGFRVVSLVPEPGATQSVTLSVPVG